MLVSKPCICMVGLFVKMSSSGLHSCVDSLRLVIFKGGVYKFIVLRLGIVEIVSVGHT